MSSTGGLQESSSTARHSSRPTAEKRTKHRDDLANLKKIPSIFSNYISRLVGAVNREKIPWDFDYTLITAYIHKGIHVVAPQLGNIPSLKNNDFNLEDRKNYAMLAPHRYLMKTTGKKPHIVSQP